MKLVTPQHCVQFNSLSDYAVSLNYIFLGGYFCFGSLICKQAQLSVKMKISISAVQLKGSPTEVHKDM